MNGDSKSRDPEKKFQGMSTCRHGKLNDITVIIQVLAFMEALKRIIGKN
jgi:hypothetical protein